MIGLYRIIAHVIASADGMIADANGEMPVSLKLGADQRYFESSLDRVDAVVHGRRSHEGHPNSARRRRLILTRRIASLTPDRDNPNGLLWNPAGARFETACAALGVESGTIAIIGGPAVYSLFLDMGYDIFHLCRAVKVRLPGGLPVFGNDRLGGDLEASLKGAGLKPGPTQWLDEEVTVTDWVRRISRPPTG